MTKTNNKQNKDQPKELHGIDFFLKRRKCQWFLICGTCTCFSTNGVRGVCITIALLPSVDWALSISTSLGHGNCRLDVSTDTGDFFVVGLSPGFLKISDCCSWFCWWVGVVFLLLSGHFMTSSVMDGLSHSICWKTKYKHPVNPFQQCNQL